MGLAAPKKRRKLAHDPNNTAWSRDTTTYGQRILARQGWTPGSYLGARSAAHESHYTAASASHVRVSLKDDNLGLGCAQAAKDEPTGLGNFQDLLGRLNGKDPAKIQQEQKERKTLGMKMYAQQKWGATRFVRAGYLVGDKIEPRLPSTKPSSRPQTESDANSDKAHSNRLDQSEHDVSTRQQQKAEKKRLKEERRTERRQRRERKDARRAAREAAKVVTGSVKVAGSGEVSVEPVAATESPPKPSAPLRRNVRERFLAQKRRAGMDPRALKEILMIKSSG